MFFLPLQVHSEFVRNIENTSVQSLIQKLSETKGTGKDRPGKEPLSRLFHSDLWVYVFPV